jgi:hypothetical protein
MCLTHFSLKGFLSLQTATKVLPSNDNFDLKFSIFQEVFVWVRVDRVLFFFEEGLPGRNLACSKKNRSVTGGEKSWLRRKKYLVR